MAGASVVVVLKGLVEVAALLVVARGAVALLSLGRHEANPVYRLLVVATTPLVRIARAVTPAVVDDRHLPLVAFVLLCGLWACLVALKVVHVLGAA